MDIVCIEKRAWESLKQHVSLLTTEVEAMKEQYCPKPRERWLDSADVCKVLNLSKRTLQTYRVKGIIPSSMIGGKYYFRESDIGDILNNGLNKP